MDVSATNSALAPSSAAAAGRTGTQSDYQTFLNMLTTQMRNQDPLEPMNASDFAAQLATFSSVEQQTQTNQLLTALIGQSGLSDLGSWVGMEARVTDGAWYSGQPIDLTPDPAVGADTVTLVVRDSTGAIVDNRSLDPTSLSYRWDGLDDAGNPLPEGKYSFEIESRAGGELLDTQPVPAYSPIQEARYEAGRTMLVMPGGIWVDSGAVTGLRRAST